MSWIIFTQPHPLDKVWEAAYAAAEQAQAAVDMLAGDYSDEEIDAASDVLADALAVIWALPARHLSDVVMKLNLAGLGSDCGARADCPFPAILSEANSLMDAGIARGAKIKKSMPDILEGVTL